MNMPFLRQLSSGRTLSLDDWVNNSSALCQLCLVAGDLPPEGAVADVLSSGDGQKDNSKLLTISLGTQVVGHGGYNSDENVVKHLNQILAELQMSLNTLLTSHSPAQETSQLAPESLTKGILNSLPGLRGHYHGDRQGSVAMSEEFYSAAESLPDEIPQEMPNTDVQQLADSMVQDIVLDAIAASSRLLSNPSESECEGAAGLGPDLSYPHMKPVLNNVVPWHIWNSIDAGDSYSGDDEEDDEDGDMKVSNELGNDNFEFDSPETHSTPTSHETCEKPEVSEPVNVINEFADSLMSGMMSGGICKASEMTIEADASSDCGKWEPDKSDLTVTCADGGIPETLTGPSDVMDDDEDQSLVGEQKIETTNSRDVQNAATVNPNPMEHPRILQYVENMMNTVCRDSRDVVLAHYNNVENTQVQAASQFVRQVMEEAAATNGNEDLEAGPSMSSQEGGDVHGVCAEGQSKEEGKVEEREPSAVTSRSCLKRLHPYDLEKDYAFQVARVSSGLLCAIENFVDNMILQSFDCARAAIKTESLDPVPETEPSERVIGEEEKVLIRDYVDGMVDDAFSSAFHKIQEFLLRPRRCGSQRCHGSRFQPCEAPSEFDVNSFVDDFVMNIMEESLFIFKTQYADKTWKKHRKASFENPLFKVDRVESRSRSSTDVSLTNDEERKCVPRPKIHPPSHRRASLGMSPRRDQYLHSDPTGSCPSRRRSYDEIQMGRRRSSTGFRDTVLSDFEDELNRSDLSSPSLHMFESEFEIQSRRRASEPASRGRMDIEFFASPKNGSKKRACSVDSTSSRRVILDWLGRRPSNSSGHSSSSRKRANSSHLDWFAQDVLVEAFNDAFVEMFGANYEELCERHRSGSSRSEDDLELDLVNCVPDCVYQYAETMAQSIVTEACTAVIHPDAEEKDEDGEYYEASEMPLTEMEYVADLFAKQILREALEYIKQQYEDSRKYCVATGGWSSSADSHLMALLQWVLVSAVGIPVLVMHTLPQDTVMQLEKLTAFIQQNHITTGELLHAILDFIMARNARGSDLGEDQGTALLKYLSHSLNV